MRRKLLVHLEGDLANIADATPRRVASKPSAGSSNLRELRREQRMLQQQDALHRLEWEINRKQAQMTRLRKDQEAALVDLRVQLNGGFHAKEVAWARERANLSGQIQRLQAVRWVLAQQDRNALTLRHPRCRKSARMAPSPKQAVRKRRCPMRVLELARRRRCRR